MAVLLYGWQRRIGVLVPSWYKRIYQSSYERKEQPSSFAALVIKLMKGTVIYGLANYSILDIVRQGVLSTNKDLWRRFDENSFQGLYAPSTTRNEPTSYLPKELHENEKRNWIFVFDLGDRKRVEEELRNSKNLHDAQVMIISHDLNIPVGLGLSVYSTPTFLKGNWRELHSSICQLINENLVEEFAEIGIDIDTSALRHLAPSESNLYPNAADTSRLAKAPAAKSQQ